MRFVLGHRGRKSQVDYVVCADGCWQWERSLNTAGYGTKCIAHRVNVLAHRWYYEQAHGPLAEGLELHHICQNKNKRCVNPEHLEALTRAEHQERHRATACNRGHEFTPENTWVTKQGYRQCRVCKRRRWNEQRVAA